MYTDTISQALSHIDQCILEAEANVFTANIGFYAKQSLTEEFTDTIITEADTSGMKGAVERAKGPAYESKLKRFLLFIPRLFKELARLLLGKEKSDEELRKEAMKSVTALKKRLPYMTDEEIKAAERDLNKKFGDKNRVKIDPRTKKIKFVVNGVDAFTNLMNIVEFVFDSITWAKKMEGNFKVWDINFWKEKGNELKELTDKTAEFITKKNDAKDIFEMFTDGGKHILDGFIRLGTLSKTIAQTTDTAIKNLELNDKGNSKQAELLSSIRDFSTKITKWQKRIFKDHDEVIELLNNLRRIDKYIIQPASDSFDQTDAKKKAKEWIENNVIIVVSNDNGDGYEGATLTGRQKVNGDIHDKFNDYNSADLEYEHDKNKKLVPKQKDFAKFKKAYKYAIRYYYEKKVKKELSEEEAKKQAEKEFDSYYDKSGFDAYGDKLWKFQFMLHPNI